MKSSIKLFLFVWVLVMSFVAVQGVNAKPLVLIEGDVVEVNYEPPYMVTILDEAGDLTDVYGMMLNFLGNIGVDLEGATDVSIKAREYLCDDGTIKFMALEIYVDGEWIDLR